MTDRQLIERIAQDVAEVKQRTRREELSLKKWLNLNELSEYLTVSIETVYAFNKAREFNLYQRSGKLKYVKREEVDAWLEMGATRLSKYNQTKTLKKAA